MNIFLVVPTVRSLGFLRSWGKEFSGCSLVVVEDGPGKTVEVPEETYKKAYHFCWQDVAQDFGKDEWIFSRQNAGIRAYGFWKAYQNGAEIIITLDDDCFPVEKNFVVQHVANLGMGAPEGWTNTFPQREFVFTRGIPYSIRKKQTVAISHGLWSNKIDLDAKTQRRYPNLNLKPYPPIVQFVPRGVYFPMCSMNLAFKREVVPIMYFPLMGSDPQGQAWGYDRFDDIWAGIFAKKICDQLGLAVINGSPLVEHRKASDPRKNFLKEKRGLATNEFLWKRVDAVKLSKKTPAACYLELAQKVVFPKEPYFTRLRQAMIIWAGLFLQKS